MSTQEHDEVTRILSKHDYIVRCVVEDNVVDVKYSDVFNLTYRVLDSKMGDDHRDLVIVYDVDKKEKITLPIYIIRWYIFLDIFRICRKHKLSHNIIRFLNTNGDQNEFIELLLLDGITEVDRSLERNMVKSIVEILKDSGSINKFDDKFISEGNFYNFSILKGLLI